MSNPCNLQPIIQQYLNLEISDSNTITLSELSRNDAANFLSEASDACGITNELSINNASVADLAYGVLNKCFNGIYNFYDQSTLFLNSSKERLIEVYNDQTPEVVTEGVNYSISTFQELNEKTYSIIDIFTKSLNGSGYESYLNPEALITIGGYILCYKAYKSKSYALLTTGALITFWGVSNIVAKPEKTLIDTTAMLFPAAYKVTRLIGKTAIPPSLKYGSNAIKYSSNTIANMAETGKNAVSSSFKWSSNKISKTASFAKNLFTKKQTQE